MRPANTNYGIPVDINTVIPYSKVWRADASSNGTTPRRRAISPSTGVPFAYAARVFLDPRIVEFDASRDGDGEARRKAVGLIVGKLYIVVYTDRGGVYRIISARRTNATEERAYGPI